MSKIGYARVSTKGQNLESQLDMLQDAGCIKIFSEKVSGRKAERTALEECMAYMREGDTMVITKLDRLGRTTKQLIELATTLEKRGIDLEIINMNVTTKDPMGKMFFTMMSAFAELEASLLSERTKKGLESARARGRNGGRPGITDDKKAMIQSLYDTQKYTGKQIAEMVGVSRATVYKVVNESKENS
ncbi:recombinase family protein [Salinicoccus roseus]|uniref:recombinase family protein n=1 Tax=Salinicoccus roseus TaxID=45670 RepID=UPI003DA1A6DC